MNSSTNATSQSEESTSIAKFQFTILASINVPTTFSTTFIAVEKDFDFLPIFMVADMSVRKFCTAASTCAGRAAGAG